MMWNHKTAGKRQKDMQQVERARKKKKRSPNTFAIKYLRSILLLSTVTQSLVYEDIWIDECPSSAISKWYYTG